MADVVKIGRSLEVLVRYRSLERWNISSVVCALLTEAFLLCLSNNFELAKKKNLLERSTLLAGYVACEMSSSTIFGDKDPSDRYKIKQSLYSLLICPVYFGCHFES